MSLLPRLNESLVRDLEEDSNSRMKSSLSCDVVQVLRRPAWFAWGKPYNSKYYEFVYTYRVLKKPGFPFLSGAARVPNHMIAQLLVILNCAARILDAHIYSEAAKALPLPASIDYQETNQLSNIDGYAATTGVKTRIVLRTDLAPQEKERAIKELLGKIQIKNEPAVFLWKLNQ